MKFSIKSKKYIIIIFFFAYSCSSLFNRNEAYKIHEKDEKVEGLLNAIKTKDMQKMISYFESDFGINDHFYPFEYNKSESYSFFYMALNEYNYEIIFYFLKNQVDVNNTRKPEMISSLYILFLKYIYLENKTDKEDFYKLVKIFIDKGADIIPRDLHYNLIHKVIDTNEKRLIDLIIKNKDDFNSMDDTGITPLSDQVIGNGKEGIKLLLEHYCVEINFKDILGYTALREAVYAGNVEIVKYLILKGADINVRDNKGISILGWAKIRLNHCDDPNVKKYNGFPLKKDILEINRILKLKGAKY